MRHKLEHYINETRWFTAKVTLKRGYPRKHRYVNVLIHGLKLDGESDVLSEHLWIQHPESSSLSYFVGTKVKFKATVRYYQKQSGERDVCLRRIEEVKKV